MDNPESNSDFDDDIVGNLPDAVYSAFLEIGEVFDKPKDDISQMSRENRITLASNDSALVCFLENYRGVSLDTKKSVIFSEDQIESINRFQPDQIKETIRDWYNLTEEELHLAIAKYHKDYLEITAS